MSTLMCPSKGVLSKMPVEIEGVLYMTADEACKLLDVSRETLNNYVNSGKLKRFKKGIGRRIYFRVSDLEELNRPREDTGSSDD